MDYDATPMTGAGPSSYNYADFHPLDYPHNNLSLDESFTIAIDHDYGCNIIPPQSSSSSNFSGIFDPAFFDHNPPDFFHHPDTPSSASSSSNSEVLTPVSDRGEIQSPVIECRVAEGTDIDMESSFGAEVAYGDDATRVPLDFRDPLLTMFKSASDDLPDDWPQLLATLCDQHPEAVKWFTETGGFLPGFDPISEPQNEHEHERDYLMQQQSSPIYPHQHSDTLSDFLSSFGDSSSLSPSASRSPSSSTQIPLHQPQPVRPIPQIPLKDLAAAAAALRLARPRGPREAHQTLSPLSLLCQPVDDSVRYQQKPFSAHNVNADH
jgi:hypothetical protein